MKTQIFAIPFILFLFCIGIQSIQAAQPQTTVADVQVIVTPKKIWFVTDESPVKKLDVQILDQNGVIVLEKEFSSKTADWSLDVHTLPSGTYQIFMDAKLCKTFVRETLRA